MQKNYTYMINTAAYISEWVNADSKVEASRLMRDKLQTKHGEKVTLTYVKAHIWRV